MTLIAPLDKNDSRPDVKEKLEAFEQEHGMVPNAIGVMAHSKVTLDMYMNMEGALSTGELSPTQREMIALAVSQANECKYCVIITSTWFFISGAKYKFIIILIFFKHFT